MKEIGKLENKMAFFFKITNQDILKTEEDGKSYRQTNVRRFCEKETFFDKVRDPRHLTGEYRWPARNKRKINFTQKQSNFMPFAFHSLNNYECHLFVKNLDEKKNDKVKIDIIPKTNEEYISVTNGCQRFIDSYRLSSISLDSLVKTLVDNSRKTFKILKKEIVDKDEILKIVIEIGEEVRSIEDLLKDYPDEKKKLEKALSTFISGNDLKRLKTEFPDKRKYLLKIGLSL